MNLPVLDDRGLCSVCGLREGHLDWCARVCDSLAADTTTWCVVAGCNHIVPRPGVRCALHVQQEAACA